MHISFPQESFHYQLQCTGNSRDTLLDSNDERDRSVVIYDRDAMLEFHYDEQGHGKTEERNRQTKYQRVPDTTTTTRHLGTDFGATESAAVPSLAEQPSIPNALANDAIHTAWNSVMSNKQ